VRVWNVDTGQTLGPPLTGNTGGVGTLAFSSDGHRLASAADDETVRLWDIDTGHDLMITEPKAVADVLLEIANA